MSNKINNLKTEKEGIDCIFLIIWKTSPDWKNHLPLHDLIFWNISKYFATAWNVLEEWTGQFEDLKNVHWVILFIFWIPISGKMLRGAISLVQKGVTDKYWFSGNVETNKE